MSGCRRQPDSLVWYTVLSPLAVSGLQLATEMRTAESGEFNDKILLSCGTFAIVRPKERSLGREVRGASLALVKETLGGPNSIALSATKFHSLPKGSWGRLRENCMRCAS